jgi:hypothetical protein
MKSIIAINVNIPTVDEYVNYLSGDSLRDYDIAIFDPELPSLERIYFDGGGSCISVEAGTRLAKAMIHWKSEFTSALDAGKTIFVILNAHKEDQFSTGSTLTNKQRTHSTSTVNNYQVLPAKIELSNSNGRKIIVTDGAYRGIYEAIKDVIQYKTIVKSGLTNKVFTAKDGAPVGGVMKFDKVPGHIVFLPFFDFESGDFTETNSEDVVVWSEKAIKTSNALIGQIVAIDKVLKGSTQKTPPPSWMDEVEEIGAAKAINEKISELDRNIASLKVARNEQVLAKEEISSYSDLLFENGKALEKAIEKTLRILGYTSESLQIDDLEIDHVIVSPSGKRMIGESEGKDNSAIDISKFRQLESNIGEDFQRDEVDEPAKGILFGNGYRLTAPNNREEQFTKKSITNAKRLGSALIRTSDLYPVAAYLLDNPEDHDFKNACRAAIDETVGGIVQFPKT